MSNFNRCHALKCDRAPTVYAKILGACNFRLITMYCEECFASVKSSFALLEEDNVCEIISEEKYNIYKSIE